MLLFAASLGLQKHERFVSACRSHRGGPSRTMQRNDAPMPACRLAELHMNHIGQERDPQAEGRQRMRRTCSTWRAASPGPAAM